MNRHSPRAFSIAVAAAALVAPLVALVALGSPAEAGSVKKHDLTTYKREAWVAIGDETPVNEIHEHLSCDDGDHAVDGIWKIDAHDGDDSSVVFEASYGDDVDPAGWHFRATNYGDGRAQVKLFVTCLDDRTGIRDGHRHDLVVGPRTAALHPALPSGPMAISHTPACGVDQIPVAPGFDFTSGSGRVFRSYASADLRAWHWSFVVTGPADLTLHLRCLDRRTTAAGAGGHVHEADTWWIATVGGQQEEVGPGISDTSVDTRRHDEGIVGGFWIDDPFHTFYLGQDARGRMRGYRFLHDGLGSASVHLGALGLDKRTGRQLAP